MKIPASERLRAEGVALLRWWLRELRDIGRQLLERTVPRLGKQVVIEFKANSAEAYALRRGSASERITILRDPDSGWPDRFPAGDALGNHHGTRATLVLAPEDTLRFDLVIPETLGRELDSVVALHLEREFPLSRDQLGVDYQILEHLPDTRKIRVQVLVARQTQLAQLRDIAQQWGLRPTRIGALSSAGAIVGDFLRSPSRFRTMRLTLLERRVFAADFVLAVTLGALIAGQWAYERIVVDAQLRRINSQAAVAYRLADRLMRESAPARALLRIARVPDASDVLATLTQTVPSYAWAYQLQVEAPSAGAMALRMGVFAPAATTLVEVLDETHRFGTVQLISATSVGSASGLDRLEVTASRAAAGQALPEQDETDDVGATP